MFQMTDSQQVTLTISFADKKGNPTPAPAGASTPLWLTDNPDLLALTPAADGLSCLVAAHGPLGQGTVSVKVTAADGSPLAAGSLGVEIIAGAPVQVVIAPGTPAEQP